MKLKLSIRNTIIILGALVMLFSINGFKQQTEKEQQYQLEVQIAKLIVSDYEDVETIEFQGWGHSMETGMWGTTVVINGSNRKGFSFSGIKGLEEISGSSYHPDTFKLVEKATTATKARIMDRVDEINTASLENVVVIYSRDVIRRK